MKTSPEGEALIEKREGMRLEMYRDSAGLPTIGVGHLLTKDELSSGKLRIAGVSIDWHEGISIGQVTALLNQDLGPAERAVNAVRVPLTQTQFDTLVSFVFNIGVNAFADSTLLKRLNAGDYDGVAFELGRWIHSAGRVDPVLEIRRKSEIDQWKAAA